jgi:hypothetical protein
VTPAATTVESVEQRLVHVDRAGKSALLAEILRQEPIDRALVFTRTKRGADKVVSALHKAGLAAEAIHGNKSQGQRERVLAAFRAGKVRTLIATDIAARRHRRRRASATWSITICRTSPKATCTASAAPRAPAHDGVRDLVLRDRGAGVPARHREAHSHDDPGGPTRPQRPATASEQHANGSAECTAAADAAEARPQRQHQRPKPWPQRQNAQNQGRKPDERRSEQPQARGSHPPQHQPRGERHEHRSERPAATR